MANYRLKLARVNSLKLRVSTRIPANLIGNQFITITRGDNGEYLINADYTVLDPSSISNPSAAFIAVLDTVSGSYKIMSIADIIAGVGTGAVRVVTEAGDITVGTNVRVLIMNRTADETPSKINLPAGALKIGGIKVVDWKGNAGTFPHDVYPSGSEKFNGAQAVWHVNGDGASAVFDPIPTLGYAV
jgi:hypothetical protein